MTTSFSGTVETGHAPRPEAPVAGTDGVLVLDTAQRCLSADTVFAHLFDLDPHAFEGRALADTALPKPLIAVLAEAADAAFAAGSVRRARVSIDEGEGGRSRSRSFAILALPGISARRYRDADRFAVRRRARRAETKHHKPTPMNAPRICVPKRRFSCAITCSASCRTICAVR